MSSDAILALISDLYSQIIRLQEENKALKEQLRKDANNE